MTFSIIVPNATQSPGLFPAQNNVNFQRLKDNINNDHNFTDSFSASQSIHKQVTFINKSPSDIPVGLPAGNGILYSANDALSAPQLYWFNGATRTQVTNTQSFVVTGSVSIPASGSFTIFADPGFSYQGSAFYYRTIGTAWVNQTVFMIPGVSNSIVAINNNSTIPATLSYSGNNLQITNNVINSAFTFVWSLLLTRLP